MRIGHQLSPSLGNGSLMGPRNRRYRLCCRRRRLRRTPGKAVHHSSIVQCSSTRYSPARLDDTRHRTARHPTDPAPGVASRRGPAVSRKPHPRRPRQRSAEVRRPAHARTAQPDGRSWEQRQREREQVRTDPLDRCGSSVADHEPDYPIAARSPAQPSCCEDG